MFMLLGMEGFHVTSASSQLSEGLAYIQLESRCDIRAYLGLEQGHALTHV